MLHPRAPSWLILLLSSTIFFFLFVQFAKSISYRDPGSRFFDPERAYEQSYSLIRSAEAAQFQADVQAWLESEPETRGHETPAALTKVGDNPQMCVQFITTARAVGTQYLDRALSSALASLTPTERSLLDIRLYFTNLNPTIHPSWNSWVRNVSDAVHSPKDIAPSALLVQMVKLAQEQNWHAKSGLDYALALKNCLDNSTAKYIVIFEGDVLVAESWFSRVMWHLREFYERGGSDEKWLQLRIFNEERASGFTDKEIFRNNVPLICVLAGLGVAGSILALRSLSRRKGSRKLDFATNYFILVLCALTIPSFIILFFATGKATVLPPSPGLRYENFGCCTQAMIYSRAHIQGIYDALTTDYMTWDYDIRIKQYGRDNGVKGLSLYPMMVQHLGFESVINPDRGDAIWSVAFEGLRRERLREEHRRMHGSLLGEEAWVDTMEKTRGWKTNKDLPSLGG